MCNLFIIRMTIVAFNELYPERQIIFEPFVHVTLDSIFFSKMLWSTVSNAFFRSKKTPKMYFPVSRAFVTLSTSVIMAWLVE